MERAAARQAIIAGAGQDTVVLCLQYLAQLLDAGRRTMVQAFSLLSTS
ncbi:hypothetical protein [Accumulibacter sp.]|uniref:Uncharacterized protein n=1 Tax=Candidatus Accumulibacter proximus TaxID=2954385 RepID=A0A935PW71_9PROT|nr:hypothetical protein [Accumulibacter sp.]MBK7673352.1 hypothetical protein [Candidatus Accumulibacter proximus]MBL8373823.1 hypothetical protein [Accumulibacter sp.]